MFRLFCVAVVVGMSAAILPLRAEPPQPLIPRKVLFGNPVKAAPKISPDGKWLSWLSPDDKNVLQVWVQRMGDKEEPRAVTADKKRGIQGYAWTFAADTLIYVQDKDGDENDHVYKVNVTDGKVVDLTPHDGVQAQILGLHRDHPDQMLVAMNRRDKRVFDIYRLDMSTGKETLDTQNPGDVVAWMTDSKFKVRLAFLMTKEGGVEIRQRADEKSEWQKVLTWGPEDVSGSVLGFTKDGKGLWILSSEGRDTLSLVKRDLETGKETLIATDDKADATAALIDPKTDEVEAVAFNRERVKWKVLKKEAFKDVEDDLKVLEKAAPGDPRVVSSDTERKTWVVAYYSDIDPLVYYLYDRGTKKLTKLFAAQPELAKHKLAPMKPVTIKSRDGLELVSYLTLPVGVEAKKLPMVLLVHGGPWARDSWGYNPEVQWLANRGYAVLQVNFRGSTGFGKKFLNAGNKEWAGKMHDDLIDAVNWAVEQGYADPKKVAIMGGSYGGYAALVGATFTPDTFACAISVVGPSNLVTLLATLPPYWEPLKKIFAQRVGDDEAFLKSRSPLFHADKIKIPVLIAQGANDPRVKQAESEQIVEAMRKAKKPVVYLLFKDEGHGFARPENEMKFAAAVEAFLAKHLGGRHESVNKEEQMEGEK